MAGDFDRMELKNACLIYSLWPGYLEHDCTGLREWAKQKDIGFHIAHSSGHAASTDHYRMAQAAYTEEAVPKVICPLRVSVMVKPWILSRDDSSLTGFAYRSRTCRVDRQAVASRGAHEFAASDPDP